MLKTRIIPTLLMRGRNLFKGEKFKPWRSVGTVMQAAKIYEMRGVDELILLDIAATIDCIPPDFELVRELTEECFMPITVGGGVWSLTHIRNLLEAGADKVSIGTAAMQSPGLINAAAKKFGSQAITVSIDATDDGVTIYSGNFMTERDPVEWAREIEDKGAGEILLCSVDRDGTMMGYNKNLIEKVSEAVKIPVIASGGCSGYRDMADILQNTQAHAVAAGALFQFTEATPAEAARCLADMGYPVREGS